MKRNADMAQLTADNIQIALVEKYKFSYEQVQRIFNKNSGGKKALTVIHQNMPTLEKLSISTHDITRMVLNGSGDSLEAFVSWHSFLMTKNKFSLQQLVDLTAQSAGNMKLNFLAKFSYTLISVHKVTQQEMIEKLSSDKYREAIQHYQDLATKPQEQAPRTLATQRPFILSLVLTPPDTPINNTNNTNVEIYDFESHSDMDSASSAGGARSNATHFDVGSLSTNSSDSSIEGFSCASRNTNNNVSVQNNTNRSSSFLQFSLNADDREEQEILAQIYSNNQSNDNPTVDEEAVANDVSSYLTIK